MLFATKRLFALAKIYSNATEAISDIRSGSSIAVGGFMSAGVPENVLKALKAYGNYDFTIVTMGSSLENYGINALISNRQVKRLITPFIGGSSEIHRQYLNGDLELELIPNGTLTEKVRAAGAGIPGFWTTTGVGTIIEEGGFPLRYRRGGKGVLILSDSKEKKTINNKEHIYEEAIRTEYSIVKAWKSDTLGNLVYKKTARNFNPEIATCSKITIAEVEEIVPAGSLDPDEIDTPSIFVQRLVKGETYEKPVIQRTHISDDGKVSLSAEVHRTNLKIARRVAQELHPGMYVKLDTGIPSLVPQFLAPGVVVASSSGVIGIQHNASKADPDLVDTNGESASIVSGGAVVSTNMMMDLLRGGHFDVSVVGAFEVSSRGDLANWYVPGLYMKGIGSSMDIVANHEARLIVAMHHTHAQRPKIVKDSNLPLTGKKCVKLIVTELGVFDFRENGLNLAEIANGVSLEEIKHKTGTAFTVSSDLKTFQ